MYSLDTKYTEVHPVWFTVFSLWDQIYSLETTKYILSGSSYFHYEIKYTHLKLTTTKYILSGSLYFHYEIKYTHLKQQSTSCLVHRIFIMRWIYSLETKYNEVLPVWFTVFLFIFSSLFWNLLKTVLILECVRWLIFFLYYYSSIPLWTKQRELRNPSDFITSQLLYFWCYAQLWKKKIIRHFKTSFFFSQQLLNKWRADF